MGRAEGAMNPAIRTMQPHVSVRVLYPFAAALRHEGVDLDLVLAAAQIQRATYSEQDSRIPFTSARRFYFAAAAASRDFALGLAAARHFALAMFQVLEYLAASCTHLEAALDTLVKNERVLSDANAIDIERRSEGILVRVEPLTAGWHHCWVEFAVGAIYLAGRRIPRDPTAATWRPIHGLRMRPPPTQRSTRSSSGPACGSTRLPAACSSPAPPCRSVWRARTLGFARCWTSIRRTWRYGECQSLRWSSEPKRSCASRSPTGTRAWTPLRPAFT